MEEQGDGEAATAVVQAKTRRGWTGPGCGRGGKGKWVDPGRTLKMELTEFPEELDVGREDKEEPRRTANFAACTAGRMEAPLTGMGMTMG